MLLPIEVEFRRVLGLLRQLRLKWQALVSIPPYGDNGAGELFRGKHTSTTMERVMVMMDPSALHAAACRSELARGGTFPPHSFSLVTVSLDIQAPPPSCLERPGKTS